MADNDNTIIDASTLEQSTQAFYRHGEAADFVKNSYDNVAGAQNIYQQGLIKSSAAQLANLTSTRALAGGFDYLTQAIFGASNSFANFSSNLDQTQSFTNQANSVINLVEKNKLLGISLKEVAGALGMKDALTASTDALQKFILSAAAGADQSLMLQKGFISIMGATGGLNKVFDAARPGLASLNDMILQQATLINKVSGATGAGSEEVSKFYQLLGSRLPGSLQDNKEGFNTLTGAMQLAAGTGRSVNDTINLMGRAWDTYGLSGRAALQFTSQMSELSNRFGVNLEYTQGFIEKNAEAFKLLSNRADDGAKSFNRWFGSLRETGLSAKESANLVSGLTDSMSRLSVAQKAFLSAQSGGPGGLRGAMQIENMIREGKIDEVLQKSEQALRKQFGGKIFDQKEAQTSEFAAAQFLRQRQLIQSGAFGIKADEAGATRLLEAFKKGTSGKEALTADGALHETLKRGDELQQTSNTFLSQLVNLAQQQLAFASKRSIEDIQSTLGPRNVAKNNTSSINNAVSNFREKSNDRSLLVASDVKSGRTNTSRLQKENFEEGGKYLTSAFPSLKGIVETISSFIERKEERTGSNKAPTQVYAPNRVITAQAVNRSVTRQAEPAPGAPAVENKKDLHGAGNTKVDVVVKGLCLSCAKPVQADHTTTAITGGTVGANRRND